MHREGFVGRERERELLDARLTAARNGQGQVVLVAGEPGVGKTRLAEEIAARSDVPTAWVRASDGDGSPPYWPFRQVLRALGGELPAGDAAQAVLWAERAAGQAMAQLAWEEADSLYGRALTAAADPPARSRLLLARARAQVRAYDVDGARQSLLAAADLAREAGNAAMLAQASLVRDG